MLLPSRCAQGLGKSHQCYLTNANPPAACGPTAAAYMMRTAPRFGTSPAVRACRNRNRKMGLPYVPPFDPVLRSHANWDLDGGSGGPGPEFGELDEHGAVGRGLPFVQPDLGIDDAVELTSTQCRTCARCSWTRGEGSNPSPPRGPPLGVQALRHLRRVEPRYAA